jgi:hypothetical protein
MLNNLGIEAQAVDGPLKPADLGGGRWASVRGFQDPFVGFGQAELATPREGEEGLRRGQGGAGK